MKKLLIVSLGVCMLGTACSRDTNRIEENTLQQSQEQSVILQTETEEFDIPATKESSLFIKEQYPDYFSSTELLERGIKYGHYEETIYSEFADKNNGYGKYYQMGKILSDTTQRIYMGTSSLDDDDVMEQLTQLEELLRFFYRDYYGNNSKK